MGLASSIHAADVPSSDGHTIQNEGVGLTQRGILNFIGAGANCVDATTKTNCTFGASYYSPLEYGAVCDGATDDATALQATFNAIPSTGGAVLFPAGDCRSSAAINSGLAAPINAAFSTATTGGTLAAGTYWYRISVTNAAGETVASNQTSQVTTGSTSTVTVNWGVITGATGAKVYGRTTGAELLMATWNGSVWSVGSGTATSWTDTGSVTPSGALPSSNTTGTKTVLIYGQGPGISSVTFTAVTAGFALAFKSMTEYGSVRDLSIYTTANSTQIGLQLMWPYLAGPPYLEHRKTCTVHDLEIAPAPSTPTAYWTVGLSLEDAWECVVNNVQFRGSFGTPPSADNWITNSKAISISGRSIDMIFHTIEMNSWHFGIWCCAIGRSGDDDAEGLQIQNMIMNRGIQGVHIFSVAEAPWLSVTSSHFNTMAAGVVTQNRYETQIKNNLFYEGGSAIGTLTNYQGIIFNNCQRCEVASNTFNLGGDGGATLVERGVQISTGGLISSAIVHIHDNIFYDVDGGDPLVYLGQTTSAGISITDNKIQIGNIVDGVGSLNANMISLHDNIPGITNAVLIASPYTAADNGSTIFCTNCLINSATCASGGTGDICVRANGVWRSD